MSLRRLLSGRLDLEMEFMAKHYTTVEIKTIRELALTHTGEQIAKKLGRTKAGVYNIAWRNDIKLNPGCQKTHTMKEVKEIVRLRNTGMTFRAVSEATGVNLSSCMYLYRRHA